MNFFKNLTRKSNTEINILLLGETGAGKSTTINAFANYMKYGSFDDAMDSNNDFVELIASQFALADPDTGEPVTITSGKDNNELGGGGKSSTREPRTYKFNYGSNLIRLIDTPGIGDTSGIDQDNKNFNQILGMLNCFKDLHGILILIKSNETRKTAFFQYCITELLTHLHKSACDNIVVCFTFSRSSFYAPGDGFSTLKGFLKDELSEVNLDLKSNKNCFFIDNEAYRFLVAKKWGYRFPESQTISFQESWDKSVEQTLKMFDYITSMKPHDLENTVSLNAARKLIYELAEPMVKLQQNVDANIAHINDKKNELQSNTKNKIDLAKNLHIEVDDLEQIQLDEPSTVCTAAKCVDTINYQGQLKVNHKQRCHEPCYLTGVQRNIVGLPDLKNCSTMDCNDNCSECKCSWEVHMHEVVTYQVVKRTVVDSNMQKQVKNMDDAIAQINSALAIMETTVKEYEKEMKVIEDIGSKFAYILIEHSNTPYNKFIEPYLDVLINEERKKLGGSKGYSRKTLDVLENMKAKHVKSVQILTAAIENKSVSPIKITEIFKFKDDLCRLKHTGPQFKQMLNNADFLTKNNFKLVEKTGFTVTSNTTSGRSGSGSTNRGASRNNQQTQQSSSKSSKHKGGHRSSGRSHSPSSSSGSDRSRSNSRSNDNFQRQSYSNSNSNFRNSTRNQSGNYPQNYPPNMPHNYPQQFSQNYPPFYPQNYPQNMYPPQMNFPQYGNYPQMNFPQDKNFPQNSSNMYPQNNQGFQNFPPNMNYPGYNPGYGNGPGNFPQTPPGYDEQQQQQQSPAKGSENNDEDNYENKGLLKDMKSLLSKFNRK